MTTTTITLNNGVDDARPRPRRLPDPARGDRRSAVAAALRDRLPPHRHRRRVRQRARGRRGDPRAPASTAPRSSSRPRSGSATTATTRRCTRSTRAPRKLGVDQIDLLILHQALPPRLRPDHRAPTGRWRRCSPTARSARSASATSCPTTSTTLLAATEVVPAVNQIEVHPYFQQPRGAGRRRRARHPDPGLVADRRHHVLPRRRAHAARSRTRPSSRSPRRTARRPAQVMLRWHLQQGRSVIPKSTKPHRIAENFDVFDFELTAERARRDRRPRHRRARRPRARGHHARDLRHADPGGLRRPIRGGRGRPKTLIVRLEPPWKGGEFA